MLILTRKLGESLCIGDDIKVSILGIHGKQVRVGIEAPAGIDVHREEVYKRIKAEQQAEPPKPPETASDDQSMP